jgi:hypothetical protein
MDDGCADVAFQQTGDYCDRIRDEESGECEYLILATCTIDPKMYQTTLSLHEDCQRHGASKHQTLD